MTNESPDVGRDFFKRNGWKDEILDIYYRYFHNNDLSDEHRTQFAPELTVLNAYHTLIRKLGPDTTVPGNVKKFFGEQNQPTLERWFIELLQNAVDASIDDQIDISLSVSRDSIQWRHNGRPFALSSDNTYPGDWAALYETKSNKEFDFENYGRFGIGFKGWLFYFKHLEIRQVWAGERNCEHTITIEHTYKNYCNTWCPPVNSTDAQCTEYTFSGLKSESSSDLFERIWNTLRSVITVLRKNITISGVDQTSLLEEKYVLRHVVQHGESNSLKLTTTEIINDQDTTVEHIHGKELNLQHLENLSGFTDALGRWIKQLKQDGEYRRRLEGVQLSDDLVQTWLAKKKIFVGLSTKPQHHWLRSFGPLDIRGLESGNSQNPYTSHWIIDAPLFPELNRVYLQTSSETNSDILMLNRFLLQEALFHVGLDLLDEQVALGNWDLWSNSQRSNPIFHLFKNELSDVVLSSKELPRPIFYVQDENGIKRSEVLYQIPDTVQKHEKIRDLLFPAICQCIAVDGQNGNQPLIDSDVQDFQRKFIPAFPKVLLYKQLLETKIDGKNCFTILKEATPQGETFYHRLLKDEVAPFDSDEEILIERYRNKVILVNPPQPKEIESSGLLKALIRVYKVSPVFVLLTDEETFFFRDKRQSTGSFLENGYWYFLRSNTHVLTSDESRTWWYTYLTYALGQSNVLHTSWIKENIQLYDRFNTEWLVANHGQNYAIFPKRRFWLHRVRAEIFSEFYQFKLSLRFQDLESIGVVSSQLPVGKYLSWEILSQESMNDLTTSSNENIEFTRNWLGKRAHRKTVGTGNQLTDVYYDMDFGHVPYVPEPITEENNSSNLLLHRSIPQKLIDTWLQHVGDIKVWSVQTENQHLALPLIMKTKNNDYESVTYNKDLINITLDKKELTSNDYTKIAQKWSKLSPILESVFVPSSKPGFQNTNRRQIEYFQMQWYDSEMFELALRTLLATFKVESFKHVSENPRSIFFRHDLNTNGAGLHYSSLSAAVAFAYLRVPRLTFVQQRCSQTFTKKSLQAFPLLKFEQSNNPSNPSIRWYVLPTQNYGEEPNYLDYVEWFRNTVDGEVVVLDQFDLSVFLQKGPTTTYKGIYNAWKNTAQELLKHIFENEYSSDLEIFVQYWVDILSILPTDRFSWLPFHLTEAQMSSIRSVLSQCSFAPENFWCEENCAKAFAECLQQNWDDVKTALIQQLRQVQSAEESAQKFRDERIFPSDLWYLKDGVWHKDIQHEWNKVNTYIVVSEDEASEFLGLEIDPMNKQKDCLKWGVSEDKTYVIVFSDDICEAKEYPRFLSKLTESKSYASLQTNFPSIDFEKLKSITTTTNAHFVTNSGWLGFIQSVIPLCILFGDLGPWISTLEQNPNVLPFMYPEVILHPQDQVINRESSSTFYPPELTLGAKGILLEFTEEQRWRLHLRENCSVKSAVDCRMMKNFIQKVIIPRLVSDSENQKELYNEIERFSVWDDTAALPFDQKGLSFMRWFTSPMLEAKKLCRELNQGNVCNANDMERLFPDETEGLNYMAEVTTSSAAKAFIERLVVTLQHLGEGNIQPSKMKEMYRGFQWTKDKMETLVRQFTNSGRGLKLYEGRHSMIVDEPLNPILSNQIRPTHRSRRHHAVSKKIGSNLLLFAGNQLFVTAYTGYRLSFANGGENGFDGQIYELSSLLEKHLQSDIWNQAGAYISVKGGLQDSSRSYTLHVHKLHAAFIIAFDRAFPNLYA